MSATDAGERTASYRDALAEPRFRAVLGAQTLAVPADTLRTLALSVSVYRATDSPLLGALAYGLPFVPQLVGGSLLGVLADRVRPRRLIVAGYAVDGVVTLVLAAGRTPVWGSLVLVVAVAFVTPVLIGVSSRVVARVLDGERYVAGRSLSLTTASLAQLLGLAAGGGVVAALGPGGAFLVAGVLHLAAGLWVRVRLPDLLVPGAAPTERSGTVRGAWEGTRRLFRDSRIRTLITLYWVPPAFVTGAESLVVPYATDRWSPGRAGLLLAAVPAGVSVGMVLVGRCATPAARDRLAVPLLLLTGTPLLPYWLPLPYALALALYGLCGIGMAYALCLQSRFRELVPAENLGQAFSLVASGTMTAQGLSPPVFGTVAEFLSTGSAIGLAGVAAVLFAALRASRVRALLARAVVRPGGTPQRSGARRPTIRRQGRQ
ncbi:MFS transporter [Streptomyces sp. NPDC050548]|uniref:MFS transporter n=1 Tax=Streptomyces sp. NPDC050548 TaxID=3365629 RepID=UPI00379F6149